MPRDVVVILRRKQSAERRTASEPNPSIAAASSRPWSPKISIPMRNSPRVARAMNNISQVRRAPRDTGRRGVAWLIDGAGGAIAVESIRPGSIIVGPTLPTGGGGGGAVAGDATGPGNIFGLAPDGFQ